MRRIVKAIHALTVLLTGSLLAAADPAVEKPPEKERSIFLIGNSLTWDTVPALLDGDVQWHVDCGKSLRYMYEHSEKPCVKSSTLWPKALKDKQYDVVCFQPHYGSTLQEDVATISKWLDMQPKAACMIHTGWARHAMRVQEYSTGDVTKKMHHSPAYIRALISELRKRHTDRDFRQTHAIDLLARIAQDAAAGKAPLNDVTELHRDAIHMKHDTGRYLMHNAMRRTLGQPLSKKGFEKLDEKMKSYLDSVLLDTLQ